MTEDVLAEIIGAFANAALNPAEWMPALSLMSDAMGSASSALELADTRSGLASINCTHPLDAEIIDLYEQRIYHINPRVARARRMPVGAMIDDRVLLVDGDPHMGEFVDWLEKTPNRFVQGAKLFQSGRHEIYFGSYFSKRQGPPETWHRDVHRAVIPHLIGFVSASRALCDRSLQNELVTIDHLEGNRPFALLDQTGRIIECSAGFEAMSKASGVLTSRFGKLAAVHAQHRSKMERFLNSALGPKRWVAPPFPIRLAAPARPRGLILRAVPIQPGNNIFALFRPTALVTLTDLDCPKRPQRHELVELFDLTIREADVAALISEGCTAEQAAAELAISEYTVRQHLKSVFSKMSVTRQADLVSLISRLS